MARDWALIEFRPGRYAKISPDGEFLGMATESEVRAWFSAGESARKPSVRKPPRPLATDSPPQILTEQPSPGRPSAPPKPATPPEEPKPTPTPTPSAATQPEQPPAALSPRTEPKPLPPFLEHLRGAPEPIITPEPPPVQEPKPLPPFLIRKREQDHPPEATTKPEIVTESPAFAAEAPSGSPPPDPIVRAPEEYRVADQPTMKEPPPPKADLYPVEQSLDLLDLDEGSEESYEPPVQAVLWPQEPDEEWLDETDQDEEETGASISPISGTPAWLSSTQPAPVEPPPSDEPSIRQDDAGRWLWLDPRQDVGHNPPSFDLAAFLQRAIDLFQSKEWTGGQKPGRLAIHPDQMVVGLSALAESLGLEVECDPLVNPGTYRLALPKDRTR